MTLLAYGGVKRSNLANALILGVVFSSLLIFVLAGLPGGLTGLTSREVAGDFSLGSLLQAAALMFVAYTGYGRIATLGEEVRAPRRTIPRAIITTLLVVMTLYVLVALTAALNLDGTVLRSAGPGLLYAAANTFAGPWLLVILTLGALCAMLSVLLNLVLGLSRVLLAMAMRGDMPEGLAKLNEAGSSPTRAVLVMGIVVALITLVGDLGLTWSFSAFTVLCYYALTNLSALRLSLEERFFPRWVSVAGLLSCLGLAAFIQWPVVLVGLGILLLGFAWYLLRKRFI